MCLSHLDVSGAIAWAGGDVVRLVWVPREVLLLLWQRTSSPPAERLVAQQPLVLSVRGIAERGVGEEWIALVVGVEALCVQAAAEVAAGGHVY